MANGYHDSVVTDHMSKYAQKRYNPLSGGFATWGWGYDGVLMGEYSYTYKSNKFKSAMKSLSDVFGLGGESG